MTRDQEWIDDAGDTMVDLKRDIQKIIAFLDSGLSLLDCECETKLGVRLCAALVKRTEKKEATC